MTLPPLEPDLVRRAELLAGGARLQELSAELNGAQPRPVTLPGLLRALRQRFLLVLLITLAVTGVAAYWAYTSRTTHASAAVLRLKDARRALTGNLAGGASDQLGGRMVDPVQSQVEILTSRSIASQVVDSVHPLRVRTREFPESLLADVSTRALEAGDSITLIFTELDFLARNEREQKRAVYGEPLQLGDVRFTIRARPEAPIGFLTIRPRDEAIKRLLGRVRVRPRENTDVVDVVYADYDPVLARTVTQSLIEIFQRYSAARAKDESVRRRLFLQEQLRQNDSMLNEARLALSHFRARQKAFSTKVKLSTEQADLNAIDIRRGELDADRRMFRDMLARLQTDGPSRQQIGALMSAPGLASNAVISELYSQLTRFQSARDSLTSGRFGVTARHPDVQRLDTLIAVTERKMVTALGSVVASLDARVTAMDNLRASNATEFPALSYSEQEEARLEEQEASARRMVSDLRAEYEKARLSEAVEVGQVEILDPASAPFSVIQVGPVRKVAFGLALGLMLGCGLAFVLDRLDTSIRARAQLRSRLGVPELAVIPPIIVRRRRALPHRTDRAGLPRGRDGGNGKPSPREQLSDGLVAATNGHSIAAEAYRLLRTNLLFSRPDGPLRTVLVTSPAPGDGKTTVAANLAVAFAQQGMRVLLIDADLRRGRVHQLFHAPREPGLAEVVLGRTPLEAAIHPTPISGLYVLSTGRLPQAPNELLGTEAMRELLTESTREYALVVVDSPPVLVASDASVIATVSDATVVVVRAGRTHENEALVTLSQLAAVGANVVGAVLNDPDAAVKHEPGYYQYGYYGKVE